MFGDMGQPDDLLEWRMHIRNLARHEIFSGPVPSSGDPKIVSLVHDKYSDPYEARKKGVREKGEIQACKNMSDVHK